jgi:hypothetical protein
MDVLKCRHLHLLIQQLDILLNYQLLQNKGFTKQPDSSTYSVALGKRETLFLWIPFNLEILCTVGCGLLFLAWNIKIYTYE